MSDNYSIPVYKTADTGELVMKKYVDSKWHKTVIGSDGYEVSESLFDNYSDSGNRYYMDDFFYERASYIEAISDDGSSASVIVAALGSSRELTMVRLGDSFTKLSAYPWLPIYDEDNELTSIFSLKSAGAISLKNATAKNLGKTASVISDSIRPSLSNRSSSSSMPAILRYGNSYVIAQQDNSQVIMVKATFE